MSDLETMTQWDHITGEAFLGPLEGKTLPVWPVDITTVGAARLEHPDAALYSSSYNSFKMWLLKFLGRNILKGRGFLPPFFGQTMHSNVDKRRPKLEQGYGVITETTQKFYPFDTLRKGRIVDSLDGRELTIECGENDGVPKARWRDSDELPMQLLTRWYGFSFTYPDCLVYD